MSLDFYLTFFPKQMGQSQNEGRQACKTLIRKVDIRLVRESRRERGIMTVASLLGLTGFFATQMVI